MIINDSALNPQNAPGAINTRWVRTATIFKGLSGSFSVPSALIRPSHLPPFSIHLTLLIVFLQGKQRNGIHSPPLLNVPTVVLLNSFALIFTWCLHWAYPMNHFLSCHSGHLHTCPFLSMLWIWKVKGLFKCSFVFQTLYLYILKI